MSLTIRDVAKIAGVSPTTVSFVINGKGTVSDETRQRILRIIEQTDFRPSINSRRLSSRKSFNICVAFNSDSSLFSDLFYLALSRGIQQTAGKMGYNVVLADFSNGVPDIILNRDTDGVIFFQDLEKEIFDQVKGLSVPFVVADSHIMNAPYAIVGVDNQNASYIAARYLVQAGHRNIAMIGPKNHVHLFESTSKGFINAQIEQGILPDRHHNIVAVENADCVSAAVDQLLALPNPPTAIFCPGDKFTINAMLYVQGLGYRIPEDISFISIDDTILCQYVRPMLTSVHIDMEMVGEASMLLLEKCIQGQPSENIMISVDQIVERGTVKRLCDSDSPKV